MKKSKCKIFFVIVLLVLMVQYPGQFAFSRTYEAGRNGMVVSASSYASDVGIRILKKGGNAVDAAVAVGFALAVTFPEAGNIGGGGFALIYRPGKGVTTIDFREKAPIAAFRDMYLDDSSKVIEGLSTYGVLAAGIPGSVAGYYLMWQKYGSLPWKTLIMPAYRLAKKGFVVTYDLERSLNYFHDKMTCFPSTAEKFFPEGKTPAAYSVLKQKDLAATLKRIARKGASEFYEGKTARLLVEAVRNNGGIWSEEDLRRYKAVERKPVDFTYRDFTVYSMGPPSSGGICLGMILNILEHFPIDTLGFLSSSAVHFMVESERFAYANRAYFLGDPDFVSIPVKKLLDKELADSLSMLIPVDSALNSHDISHLNFPQESEQTTHFAVIDRNGMAVSLTTTLNSSFGSKFVANGTGILLNNEMDDFSIKPGYPNIYGLIGAEANAVESEKRMLSSMTPTMVFKGDSLLYLLGTPGGATIITTIAQLIVDLVDFDMNVWQAVDAPRFHHQWKPDLIFFEPYAFQPDTKKNLEKMGYELYQRSYIGDANAIAVDYEKGVYIGVPDKRRKSAARGY